MPFFPTPTLNGNNKPDLGGESALDKMAGFMNGLTAQNRALSGSLVPLTALEPYFPPEMIGGSCPQVPGQEEQMAWQAAAEALDSERVHLVWQVQQGMVWFLAVKSSDLASHASSWCPLAALLPGMENAHAAPVVYLYEYDGITTMMTLSTGELSIHRGASNVIQAKAERVARDLNGAPIYNLLPEQIDQLTPVPWRSISLMEDRTRRFLALSSTMVGLAAAVIAFTIWLLASFASLAMRHDLTQAQEQSVTRVEELMHKAIELRASPLHTQVGRFAELNDQLLRVGGWLKQYKVAGSRVEWKAVLPVGITSDTIAKLGARTVEVTDEGIIVAGN